MNLFPISDLQRFSGIKAHTIRAWEHRYNALSPERSTGNTRYYSSDQLKRLLNIVSLLNAGYKISEVSTLSDKKIAVLLDDLLDENITDNPEQEYFISQLISACIDFNEEHFEKIFACCILRFGLKEAYLKVIYPFLFRVGIMWAKSAIPPAQEHFVSNLLRQKLSAAIDGLPPATDRRDSWLLFLPEDEFHEIGLLLSSYLIRLAGKKVYYLGANLPFESLKIATEQLKPAHLFFFITHYDDPVETQKYINQLSQSFPGSDIYVSGNEKLISELKKGKRVYWVKTVQDLEQKLS